MRNIILALVLIFISATFVLASPFVVTDPVSSKLLKECVIKIDGTESIINAQAVDSDNVRCVIDVESVSEGEHTISIKAKNIWGESDEVPFVFSKQLPPNPSNIHLEP